MILKPSRLSLIAAFVLLLALACLFWLARAPDQFDPNAIPSSGTSRLTKDQLLQQLQQQTDDSAFRFRMETNPSVHDNIADLLLENPVENHFDIQIIISLDSSHKTLFKSDLIPPGAQLLQAKLSSSLPLGSYNASALVSFFDPVSHKQLPGSLNLALSLSVS